MSKINEITTEMMEHICDNICTYPEKCSCQEVLDNICAECKMGGFVCAIINNQETNDEFEELEGYNYDGQPIYVKKGSEKSE